MVEGTIADYASIGYKGSIYINDTSAKTGSWRKIYVVTACVFTTLTDGLMTGTPTGPTFPAGCVLTGSFTAITLASGAVIAYK
jgi:hypothetical protein